jgi:hypothetical protein
MVVSKMRIWRGLAGSTLLVASLATVQATDFRLSNFTGNGKITWTNAFHAGVCSVQTAATPAGPWTPLTNVFTTNSSASVNLGASPTNRFVRALASDISATNESGFANFTQSYGLLRTVAGNGAGRTDTVNYWLSEYEGGFATNAALSRPHFAMADAAGNIFIADKDSHSVLKISRDGRIHTAAGTHVSGTGADTANWATNVALNSPNGLWVGGDGSVYILDTGNGKVRWLATNGLMTTLFTVTGGIGGGRGLWVRDDRALAYFISGNDLKRWTSGGTLKSLNNDNFVDPGNIWVRADGNVIVTDRGANLVYLVTATGASAGARTVLFGDGSNSPVVDGTPALSNGLYGVRGVWPVPTGGYLLATHEGSQILYVDSAGILHVLLDGYPGYSYGDGEWFYTPGWKVSEVRSVSMDPHGNILIVESDYGYLRQVDFQRLQP